MSKLTSTILGAALLAAASFTASRGEAAEACIPASLRAALADCTAVASSPAAPLADVLSAAAQLQSRTGSGNLPGNKSARKGAVAPLVPRDLDDAEKKQEGLFHGFLCADKPAPGDVKASQQHAEIEYALARLYFGANRFREAAVTFGDIALHRSETTVGVYASQLYLESLNVLGSAEAPSCYEDMARDVPQFLGLYCKDGKETVNVDHCGVMSRIQLDILRLQAEQKVNEANRGGPDAFFTYRAAGAMYLQIWEQYGRAACEAKSQSCARMEEVLYNAARAFQAARDIDKAIAVRTIMVDPRYHLELTELAKKAPYEIGGNYQAMAIYDEAASWYERFARANPATEKAPDALSDALVLRLGLGQLAQADADADLFNKSYGSKRPGQTARIVFAMASHALDQHDWKAVKRRFESGMSQIDKNGTIDIQIQAHAALGRALHELHKEPEAAAEYGKVRAIYRDPEAVIKKVTRDSGEDLADRTVAKLLTAVGEAIFFFAEEKRRAAEAIQLPEFKGTGRREDFMAHINGPVRTWLLARRAAIEVAEKAYGEGLALQPMAAPKWVVPSAARVATMHGDLAKQLRSMPPPKGWKRSGPSPWGTTWEEIRAAFRTALVEVSEPMLARAKAANRSCVSYAVKYQWFDESSLACSAWLSRRFPAEYPRIDEIVDRPSHRFFALDRELPIGGVKLDR